VHIGVSAWRLAGQRLGIGRYIEYLLKHWATQLQPDERATLFVHEPLAEPLRALAPAIDSVLVRPRLTNALWENLLLPWHARGVDVLFGPSYTLPLTWRGPTVVSIHSVDEAEKGAHPRWHDLTYGTKYRLSARRADMVIVNSESTRIRVIEHYRIPADRVVAIWLGADEAFRPLDDPAEASATRRKYVGDDRPYVLFVGGLSRRRNVPVLMEAFGRLRRERDIPHALLLVGPNRAGLPLEALARQFGITGRFVQTDGRFARHADLAPIYRAADAFVLPSLSEGFSLTLAEAMSCGTPAITCNRATLGEMAHGHALTIDDPTVETVADALGRVLEGEDLRRTLRARELERAKAFDWAVTASRTLEVIRRVGGG